MKAPGTMGMKLDGFGRACAARSVGFRQPRGDAGRIPPAYVINLDRAAERWAFMEGHCRDRGFEVRRVSAVDGRALAPAGIDRLRTGTARSLTDAEIACFESHKKVWRMVLDTGEPWALVLEDDVCLATGAAPLTARLAADGPAPIIKLNAYRKGIRVIARPLWEGAGHRLLAPAGKTIDSSAYLISRAGAAAALARFDSYAEAVDLALFDPANGIGVAQVVPALSVQQKYAGFRFLEGAAHESALDTGREEVRSIARRKRRRSPGAIVAAEAGRFFRRRVEPRLLWLTNRFRPPEERLAHVMVWFPRPE